MTAKNEQAMREAAQAAYELLSSGLGIPDASYHIVTNLAAALSEQAAQAVEVAEIQARAVGSREWTRVQPTKQEPTARERADYLLRLKNGNGQPAYEVRELFTPPTGTAPAVPAGDALLREVDEWLRVETWAHPGDLPDRIRAYLGEPDTKGGGA